MDDDEQDPEAVGEILADRTARAILVETSQQPMSATRLKQRCDASGPTIYRRLEQLREAEFVVEQTRPDPDGGHHRKVYAPNLDRVVVDLEDGDLSVRVEQDESMADRFTRLVEEL